MHRPYAGGIPWQRLDAGIWRRLKGPGVIFSRPIREVARPPGLEIPGPHFHICRHNPSSRPRGLWASSTASRLPARPPAAGNGPGSAMGVCACPAPAVVLPFRRASGRRPFPPALPWPLSVSTPCSLTTAPHRTPFSCLLAHCYPAGMPHDSAHRVGSHFPSPPFPASDLFGFPPKRLEERRGAAPPKPRPEIRAAV